MITMRTEECSLPRVVRQLEGWSFNLTFLTRIPGGKRGMSSAPLLALHGLFRDRTLSPVCKVETHSGGFDIVSDDGT